MIDYRFLEIAELGDYDRLGQALAQRFPEAEHGLLIGELKERLGLTCRAVLLESPYRDFDHSSVFALFYAKKHRPPARDCIRLHLFAGTDLTDEQYIGSYVVRDSRIDSCGRALLDPAYLIDRERAYLLGVEMTAHLAGTPLPKRVFPWMAQDTDIAVCAHVAVWTIVNYYGFKYPEYCRRSIGSIAEQTPPGLGRRVPSEGLDLSQVSDLLAANGFFPLVLSKDTLGELEFFRALFSYIESGIPMVAAMTGRQHAVTIIGHGPVDEAALSAATDWSFHSDFIDDLIVVDDNRLPYSRLSRGGGTSDMAGFADLDHVIVPLSEKMYLNASIVHERVLGLLKAGALAIDEPAVLRIYLTSNRSLKRELQTHQHMNAVLKDVLTRLELPRFVWCAEIATPPQYARQLTGARILIDATAGTYERDPWLFWHDVLGLRYRSGSIMEALDVPIAPYDLYRNNLTEVKRR
ncbi:hypothetical protein [Rhabdochromatium marinum]|uniref:hypothetical protein n=1 Tax=Rhabdochromatium marinum TaxID=48729 RepID=UPI00190856A6|nr:hypothetical protein [Rhabdochromatium marinum]MBK1650481.1 hypothetical protein [Rhabdochromatium marinum]